jgi:hypothetical protein
MRHLSSLLLCLTVCFGLSGGVARAGSLAAPGPNPNWTDMQQFEWYLGYMSRAANTCGTYTESAVLRDLARMSPYGEIGLGTITGDGFAGPVCGRINNRAKELAADAGKIRGYIETAYNCNGSGCYGQKLSDWQFHACADKLKEHLNGLIDDPDDIDKVTISDVKKSAKIDHHQARVRLNSCQGSLYIDMRDSCYVEREYTRGDCKIAGVDGF